MRIGIINNTQNKTKQGQTLTFQAKEKSFVDLYKGVLKTGEALQKDKVSEKQLRNALKEALEIIKKKCRTDHDFHEANIKINFGKMQSSITKKLFSNNVESQKEAISKVLDFRKYSPTRPFNSPEYMEENPANKYIWKKIIPYIQETQNKDLANHFLESSEIDSKNWHSGQFNDAVILERIGFLKAFKPMAKEKYNNELKGFTREGHYESFPIGYMGNNEVSAEEIIAAAEGRKFNRTEYYMREYAQ